MATRNHGDKSSDVGGRVGVDVRAKPPYVASEGALPRGDGLVVEGEPHQLAGERCGESRKIAKALDRHGLGKGRCKRGEGSAELDVDTMACLGVLEGGAHRCGASWP